MKARQIIESDKPLMSIDGRTDLSQEILHRALSAKRHDRVMDRDRRLRRSYLGWGALIASPWSAYAYLGESFIFAHTPAFAVIPGVMGMAAMMMLPPVLIIGSFIKTGERRRIEQGIPTYLPPPPTISDGTIGQGWHPGYRDVIFDRTTAVITAIDVKSSSEEMQFHICEFARRAKELVGVMGNLPIHEPIGGSRHHYWPNRHVISNGDDKQTVSYDDNLPLEAQRAKVRRIMEELKHDLDQVENGVGPYDIIPSVLDLVAAVRRVLELSGHDASQLREKHEPIALAEPKAEGLPRDTPPAVRAALDLVKRATDLDPESVDGLGNRIEPLNGHVMRILSTYREACEIADDEQRAVLSSQLEEAMGHVAAAARQGIDLHQKARLERFGTELRFIASRNGDHS